MKFTTGLLLFGLILAARPARAQNEPALILADPSTLARVRARVQAGDPELAPAIKALRAEAERALGLAPPSVMDKKKIPPSGDKHDFMSHGPYWWPDPQKKDGLPYIRRDGEVNPESRGAASDDPALGRMTGAVGALALAYQLGGEEKYATAAARLLRAWFLDPATRMNPNLNFGQAIPGICEGRGIGIIDTVCLLPIPDATTVLTASAAWTAADQQAIKEWFTRYLDWLLTSKNGKEEAAAKNNHGTYYDAQVAVFALYVGRPAAARETLEGAKEKRIAVQIQPDGRQPLELARTKSFGYSHMNLNGMLTLAALGRRVGVDLAGFKTSDGRSIRGAVDYLLQYADPAKKWPDPQIHGYHAEDLYDTALRAAVLYDDPALFEIAGRLCVKDNLGDRIRLQLNR